jgi:hypothetical protein
MCQSIVPTIDRKHRSLGSLRLFASALDVWLPDALAELSLAVALRREKNEALNAFLSNYDGNDEAALIGMVRIVRRNGRNGRKAGRGRGK